MDEIKKRKKGRPKTVYKTPGRKPLLNAKILIALCDYVSEGYSIQDTCVMAGISQTSYYNWVNQGEEDFTIGKDTIYVELLQGVKRANSSYKHKLQENIRKAGLDPNKWQANAWLLERKYYKEFGRQVLETNSEDTQELSVKMVIVDKANKDRIEQLEKELDNGS